MSTKQDARQRKEIKEHRERMARARGEAVIDKAAISAVWVAAIALSGLVALSICVLLEVAP